MDAFARVRRAGGSFVFVAQIELEEQRRSSRGRSKDKRKRKSHRGECGEKGAQPSPEGSESKKTCPTSHAPATLHPEVDSSAEELLSSF